MNPINPEAALSRLQALCARAEHCESEMRDKLRTWGIAPADADKIIAALIRDRYIDDARFASAYVRDKSGLARWGRIKIRMALAQKRISRDVIAAALDEIDQQTYLSNLTSLLCSKSKSTPDKIKLFRFAATRGYESDVIRQALKSLSNGQD